jgi:hypothetical protein
MGSLLDHPEVSIPAPIYRCQGESLEMKDGGDEAGSFGPLGMSSFQGSVDLSFRGME